MVARALSVVGGYVVLLFIITDQSGSWRTLAVEEVKREFSANREEVKRIFD